ncbi:MAG: hypothetical protein GTN86_01070 [Xanthomonadales bacterium]|nr:hypothetical protein [Xanthomonadales bacterium]NIN58405.1 hypothetical protein [Xanthomonadales bacterium]NIN73742.1 hypothetical protein [Xanthomonadales bacterium]NIO14540.1 hypothetical protein [Xanthomonadales bacterium]NIP10798.1 hypothetical protein [Xanthomonadales bacterium]
MPLRSALHNWHLANGAVFRPVAGRELVAHYGSSEQEQDARKRLGMVDMSLWPRRGYRGPEVARWLAPSLPLPDAVNQVQRTQSGELVLRPADTEYWWLGSLAGPGPGEMSGLAPGRLPTGVHDLACEHSHALFAVGGTQAPPCLSRLCALDVRPDRFGPESMAQTLVAGVSALLLRQGTPGLPVYLVFCESSLARYLWESLLHAGREFGAAAAGYTALHGVLTQPTDAAFDGPPP